MIEPEDHLFLSMHRMLAEGLEPSERQDELWQRYGETVAVLILDTAGFSRVSQSHGILHFLSRLLMLRRLCETVFESHGCLRLRFDADNAFVAFSTTDSAILSALALHRALHDSGLMLTETEQMQVSIGIGFGEMLFSETLEGYFGEEMNYASKLGEDVGMGNQTLITDRAYREASDELLAGFAPMTVELSGITLDHHVHNFDPKQRS